MKQWTRTRPVGNPLVCKNPFACTFTANNRVSLNELIYNLDQWNLDVDESSLASNSPSSLVFPDLDTMAIQINESILQTVINIIKQDPSLAFSPQYIVCKARNQQDTNH